MNMKKVGKIYLIVITVLLSMWLLPRLYYIITVKSVSTPFTLYSCTVEDFVSLQDRSGKDFVFSDTQGTMYGDSVLPFFYYRVLSSRNHVPEKIAGHVFTGEQIERNNIIFTSSPKEVNNDVPNVYMLLESEPERVELEDPQYAFVTRKDGIRIVEIATNERAAAMEADFAHALDSVGFRYPARIVSGNPSTHKEYDEGYMVTDADGKLFHIKLCRGKACVEFIDAGGVDIEHIFITENENRASLAYLFDTEGRFYVLDSLRRVVPTDVVADVKKNDFLIVGDILNYTVRVSDSNGENYWALRSDDFSTVDTFRRDYPEDRVFDLPKYILPARLSLSSSLSSRICPVFSDFSWIGLCVTLALVACL